MLAQGRVERTESGIRRPSMCEGVCGSRALWWRGATVTRHVERAAFYTRDDVATIRIRYLSIGVELRPELCGAEPIRSQSGQRPVISLESRR